MVKPYVYVDITRLEKTISFVYDFLNDYQKYFDEMDKTMNSMEQSWVSNDYTLFMQKWNQFYRGKSVGVGMRKELNSYKKYLEYAVSQYKKCQSNAYSRSSKLK